MLIKHRDEAAVPGNVAGPSPDDRSVASGRTMDEIAAGKGRRAKPFMTASGSVVGAVWQSNRNDGQAAASPRIATSVKSPRAEAKRKTAGSLPPFIEPQPAKSVAKPPAGPGWAHEIANPRTGRIRQTSCRPKVLVSSFWVPSFSVATS
jgi:bifunctional non-homologous end joining protein LigD